jgi:hypothetical protein
MSVSENSTIAPSSDFEGSLQYLDEYTGIQKPGDEASIAKKIRRTQRPTNATTNSPAYADLLHLLKQGEDESEEGDKATISTVRS